MNLTEMELAVLASIDNSEYGDYLNDDIWTFSVWDNIDRGVVPNRQSLPGIISSLVKKGAVNAYDIPDSGNGLNDDACIGMTNAGATAYVEAANGDTNKPARG